MQPLTQGIQATAAATSCGNHVTHVECGQHKAMLFTVWSVEPTNNFNHSHYIAED